MPDNTEDEPLDNPINTHSETASDKHLFNEVTASTNPNQEIENMEVHHHAHHGGRKNWRSYFWEFLMLFLAVFCGFLAEYQLEHTIEDQREVKFVQSLIEDLKTDTANLETYIEIRKSKRIMMDSLVMLLTTGLHSQMGNSTYFLARYVFHGPPFVSTDGTMQQLKNAGNLRLIKDGKIIKDILAYDALVKNLGEWDESDIRIRTSFREIGGTIFSANLFYKALDSNFRFVRPTDNPQLITGNMVAINNVAFQIQYLALSSLGNSQRGNLVKTKAEVLIDLLKKEYHME